MKMQKARTVVVIVAAAVVIGIVSAVVYVHRTRPASEPIPPSSPSPSPKEAGAPDLRTPAVAVRTVLSLVDQGATDGLALCLLEKTDDAVSDLYPRYLGRPVELVEVIADEQSARVVWEAAVHTEFSRNGNHWSPGETIMLTARLVRVGGLWKLLELHEKEENGAQPQETSAS